jgi:tetratricopeptide (TPR) repeat protein
LIRTCLCVKGSDRFALHPLLRREVVNRARDPQRPEKNQLWRLRVAERRNTHQRLHQEFLSAPATSFRDQLEWLHHELLGSTAAPSPGDPRLRFVEQLHELGRTLSYGFHEHRRAADLFRLALEFDPDHPYSHHYLAFNLDWLAQDTREVEAHYQKAIDLQPTHCWWWSRWVSYLATRGRFQQARSVWRAALDALSVSEEGSPDWVYLSLHRWVARWLLHWAELDFAEDVLRSIPSSLANRDASIQALWNLLGALRIAEQGPAVFPLSVPITQWWSANGHTGLPLTWRDQPMRLWKPARIESVDGRVGRVSLVVADPPIDQKVMLHYREEELSREQVEQAAHEFTWADLEQGRFLELAYYGSENTLRIALHRVTEFRDPQLIPLVPPPDRWYRQTIEAAWDSTGEVA